MLKKMVILPAMTRTTAMMMGQKLMVMEASGTWKSLVVVSTRLLIFSAIVSSSMRLLMASMPPSRAEVDIGETVSEIFVQMSKWRDGTDLTGFKFPNM